MEWYLKKKKNLSSFGNSADLNLQSVKGLAYNYLKAILHDLCRELMDSWLPDKTARQL